VTRSGRATSTLSIGDDSTRRTNHRARDSVAPPRGDAARSHWLRRRGYLDERAAEERCNEPAEPEALDGCMQLALAGGSFLARPVEPKGNPDADMERRERRFSASCDGFDVHCAVRIAKGDDQGRERLVRYCARPPFALDRIEVLSDGRVSYLLKGPRRGRTHRVMTPMEFMARLAVLIPPPKIPTVRYHGVFAPRSSWRALVTPKPPHKAAKPKPCAEQAPGAPASPAPAPAPASASAPAPALVSPAPAPPCASPPCASPSPKASPAPAAPVVRVEPTTITIDHWGRLREGELFATSPYVAWAVLMKRTWGLDVLACPRCARKMRVLSTITDPATIRRILTHLRVRADPLPRAPSRDPTWEQANLGFDAA
jgi:hypothetical protein